MSTSRENFAKSWLTEMPEGIGSFETYDAIKYHINDLLKNGVKFVDLENGIKKIELNQTIYYWIEDRKQNIILAIELEKLPQALVIRLTGKHPMYRGKSPYASELYKFILNDNKHFSIRLLSDVTLSDEGKAIWDRLFDMGVNVSVYDKENPGATFTTFKSQDEMNQYFKNDDTDFRRYQYVLSESGEMLAETRSHFHIRRFREQIKGML
jgi:hypothetical protein